MKNDQCCIVIKKIFASILSCIVDIVVDSKFIQFDISFEPITYNKLLYLSSYMFCLNKYSYFRNFVVGQFVKLL